MNEDGTGELLSIHIICFSISLLVYWVARSNNKLSMIKKYQKSLTESSANGMTNLSVLMGMIIIYLLLMVSLLGLDVSIEHQFCQVWSILAVVVVPEQSCREAGNTG